MERRSKRIFINRNPALAELGKQEIKSSERYHGISNRIYRIIAGMCGDWFNIVFIYKVFHTTTYIVFGVFMPRVNAQRRASIARKGFIKSIAGYPRIAIAAIRGFFGNSNANCHQQKGMCFCRKCSVQLVPQKNAKIIFNSKANSFFVECMQCGKRACA